MTDGWSSASQPLRQWLTSYWFSWSLIGVIRGRWRCKSGEFESLGSRRPSLYGSGEDQQISWGMAAFTDATNRRFPVVLQCGGFAWVSFAFVFINGGHNASVVTTIISKFFGLYIVVAGLSLPFLHIWLSIITTWVVSSHSDFLCVSTRLSLLSTMCVRLWLDLSLGRTACVSSIWGLLFVDQFYSSIIMVLSNKLWSCSIFFLLNWSFLCISSIFTNKFNQHLRSNSLIIGSYLQLLFTHVIC